MFPADDDPKKTSVMAGFDPEGSPVRLERLLQPLGLAHPAVRFDEFRREWLVHD